MGLKTDPDVGGIELSFDILSVTGIQWIARLFFFYEI